MCDRCDEFARIARKRLYRIEELERENWNLQSKLENAENKIRRELEPRIKREERAYDIMVSSPQTGEDEV